MINIIKKLFKSQKPVKQETVKKFRKIKEPEKTLTEKEIATAAGEPYIKIIDMEIDPNNINSGTLTFDWNSKFVANLARAGYQRKPGEPEDVIVNRWFTEVCRNVALEFYEQEMADPLKRETDDLRYINRRDLGNGRSEIS